MDLVCNNQLADCLLNECEWMEITPVSFDSLNDFKLVYDAFIGEYSVVYATPSGGFIDFNKFFELFCNIYTVHYQSLEDTIKAPFFDFESGELMVDKLPEGLDSYINRSTFYAFLNRFHDYFTDRFEIVKKPVMKSSPVNKNPVNYTVSYSYDKRSLQKFIDDVTNHLDLNKDHTFLNSDKNHLNILFNV